MENVYSIDGFLLSFPVWTVGETHGSADDLHQVKDIKTSHIAITIFKDREAAEDFVAEICPELVVWPIGEPYQFIDTLAETNKEVTHVVFDPDISTRDVLCTASITTILKRAYHWFN